jgi:NhaA family Na+:H+ antiporter
MNLTDQPGRRGSHRTRRPPLQRLLYPFQQFLQIEASSGIVLLICTATALIWANSGFGDAYRRILDTRLTFGLDDHVIDRSLLFWINDGLMAVFFFVVGLEIKRELIAGELAEKRKAALPVVAALGGMAVPALIYATFNWGTRDIRGWGVPMATDIAFAIGVLALVGSRVPSALKVFLTALAIVDDIGAVAVIALFYGHSIVLPALGLGAALLAVSFAAGRGGIRSPIVYALLGFAAWAAFLRSGIHATIAGVLLAMTIPASTKLDAAGFRARLQKALADFGELADNSGSALAAEQQAAIAVLESACEEVQTPLQRLERTLHPWVSYGIMPLFAMANAGVEVSDMGLIERAQVPLGIMLGLVIGKPVGITVFSWLAVRLGFAERPSDVSWTQLLGAGMLGGIGFTMALFIAGLAFSSPTTLAAAKGAILGASLLAGVVGYVFLRAVHSPEGPDAAPGA